MASLTSRLPWARPRRRATLTVRVLRVAVSVALLGGLLTPVSLLAAAPAAAATCPCSIWAAGTAPAVPADPDTAAVELGVKFRSDVDGAVAGVRFYKGTGNTGTHVGHLWTRAGGILATATFSAETGSGWQQVLFPAPVPITAGTTYVASYYAPNGHYAADSGFFAGSGVDNAPLHALADGTDGASGIYRYGTGGGFPGNTWLSANYWVDVVFTTSVVDASPPVVTSTAPAGNATGVPVTTAVSASFSEDVQPGTIGFTLRNPAGTAIPVAQGYDPASRTATWTPGTPLAVSTVYTATVGPAADTAGNLLAQPVSWAFSTSGPTACPCTLWPASTTPAVPNVADSNAVEVGLKFRSSAAGLIRGIRFYKGPQNTGSHTGSLWTAAGTRLATLTFTGETASGWQQAQFPAPVPIDGNTTYVASYHTNTGFYASDNNGFAAAVSSGPLTALANGTEGGNGVYLYGGGGFPVNTFQSSNYWVDVVFDLSGPDLTPPTVTTRTPAPDSAGNATGTSVTAAFSEDIQPASIVFTLTDPAGTPVPGTVSYDAATRRASFAPLSVLANSTAYTATISGARDVAGNPMAGAVSWPFTTAAPPPPPPTQGPGGPILVIGNAASATSQFSLYTAEILRAEGLNEFATADLGGVSPATLAGFDVVILGATALTPSQVSMFSTWVAGGGRLIAFRPDKQLAGLLGLTATTGTISNAYLKVNTAAPPGAGITDQTMQYHGIADQYLLSGATSVATLFSTATAGTTAPAVTDRPVGAAGGRAAAFSYDLAQSIVYTRQGNPAWSGQERDGQTPIRSDDLYFGGSPSTDWVDLSKVAIPQADEQQRLLANLIGSMELDRRPLPRFWYLPRGLKAAVVGTGDDHSTGGTAGRLDQYAASSPVGCSVADWTCPRFTSYMYPDTPLSNSDAATYRAAGFELGLHPQSNCGNFTAASLENVYASQLSQFHTRWPSLPNPVTSRFHCIVYSDWASQPKTELRHGIRLDTNYYYWPGSWITNRPGFMTGSGMPMRFADTDGTILDVYQAATQLTDESGQSYPATPNALLDNALGPLGYYGAFVANMHTDNAATFEDDQLLAVAQARGVPLISAAQLLTWVDGRNGSSFGDLVWAGNTLAFTVASGAGANGLTGMVPTVAAGGATLTTLTRAGVAVPFTRTTVKGVEYAFFTALPGAYTAAYGASGAGAGPAAAVPAGRPRSVPVADSVAPFLSAPATFALPDGTASVTWASGEPASTEVRYGTSAGQLDRSGFDTGRATAHGVVLTHLDPDTTYYYRLVSTDAAGNLTVWPTADRPPATFVSAASGVADRSPVRLQPGSRTAAPSRVLDAHAMASWDRAYWRADLPAGMTVTVSVRTGSTARPDGTWTGWQPLAGPGARVPGSSRYLQYQVTLSTAVAGRAPVLRGIGFTANIAPVPQIGEVHHH
jgi:methionine-rich copper-binding protein CopC